MEYEDKAKEYIEAAQKYYDELDSYYHLAKKPFSYAKEAARTLYELGILLSELFLAEKQVIVDFGAGVCWLDKFLNKLGLTTISLDVSFTALKLGKNLFQADNTINWDLHPIFIQYDGFNLPFKDKSIDRIISFDSLHHVLDIEKILNEFYRVLKDGGIAAFREPGLGHSKTSVAKYEMERYGILERDLDINEIIGISEKLGFNIILKPYPDPFNIKFNSKQLKDFIKDGKHFPTDLIKENIQHTYLFILIKGKQLFYSNSPSNLLAELELIENLGIIEAKPFELIKLKIKIKNIGDTIWICKGEDYKGLVKIGINILNIEHKPLLWDYIRFDLPYDVFPGEEIIEEILIPPPNFKEDYIISIDLVCENICWFQHLGTLPVEVKVKPYYLDAELEIINFLTLYNANPGDIIKIKLKGKNKSNITWNSSLRDEKYAIRIGGHLLNDRYETLQNDYFRANLSEDILPNQEFFQEISLKAPAFKGKYYIAIDLVCEQFSWFHPLGSDSLNLICIQVS